MKPKTCKTCKTKFTPIRFGQTCCSLGCAIKYSGELKIKAEKKKQQQEKKVLREKVTNWKVKVQKKVQEIARFIDKGLSCPSKKTTNCQLQGGHLFAKGRETQMRYNLHNIHRQSAQSNHWENDDANFRKGIADEYGQHYFEFIESLKLTPQPKYKEIEYMEFYKKACKISNQLKKLNNEYSLEERIELRNRFNLEIGIYEEKYCVYQK